MVAVIFPGQGSQVPGMGQDLYDHHPEAREVFDRASSIVGRDIADLCFNSDTETLKLTQNAQMALYVTGYAAYRCLISAFPSLQPAAFAGHSVGEYAALTASGTLSLEDGVRLVNRRGELMAAAGEERPGTMAAVLGMSITDLEAALKELAPQGVAVVANDNCPGQVVISGDVDAIAAAGALLPERGAKRVLGLNVSGAFHSPLMESSAKRMGEELAKTTFNQPSAPVISNVTAQPGEDWKDLLEQQLKSQVKWTSTIETMKALGITRYVECGAGEVLIGMVRRIDPDAKRQKVMDTATLKEAVQELAEAE